MNLIQKTSVKSILDHRCVPVCACTLYMSGSVSMYCLAFCCIYPSVVIHKWQLVQWTGSHISVISVTQPQICTCNSLF